MGFFKARYVRDYMAARKIKSVFVWAAEIAAVVIAAFVGQIVMKKITWSNNITVIVESVKAFHFFNYSKSCISNKNSRFLDF